MCSNMSELRAILEDIRMEYILAGQEEIRLEHRKEKENEQKFSGRRTNYLLLSSLNFASKF